MSRDQTPNVFEIEDIRHFEVLNSPVRLRILRNLESPSSVKDVAHRLAVPPTRLYYHFNMLADSGVIEVVETRKVGAMIEKIYRRTADNFKPSSRLVERGYHPADLARVGAGVVLDSARIDAETALRDHFSRQMAGETDEDFVGELGRSIVYLDPEDVGKVREALEGLVALVQDLDRKEGGTEFGITLAFFPVAGSERPQ